MSLRPTEIQIIISATRDIERIQQLTQQQTRSQQEQMAVQFQQEMEERKKQAQATAKAEKSTIKNIEENSEEKRHRTPKRKQQAGVPVEGDEKKDPGNDDPHIIDMLV